MTEKINHYERTNITGIVLLSLGVAAGGLSAILFSDMNNHASNDYSTTWGEAASGLTCAGVGLGLMIHGTILLINSSIRLDKLKARHKGISFDIISDPRQVGLTLKYKF